MNYNPAFDDCNAGFLGRIREKVFGTLQKFAWKCCQALQDGTLSLDYPEKAGIFRP